MRYEYGFFLYCSKLAQFNEALEGVKNTVGMHACRKMIDESTLIQRARYVISRTVSTNMAIGQYTIIWHT